MSTYVPMATQEPKTGRWMRTEADGWIRARVRRYRQLCGCPGAARQGLDETLQVATRVAVALCSNHTRTHGWAREPGGNDGLSICKRVVGCREGQLRDVQVLPNTNVLMNESTRSV